MFLFVVLFLYGLAGEKRGGRLFRFFRDTIRFSRLSLKLGGAKNHRFCSQLKSVGLRIIDSVPN
jgi:hypothetical protein